jgi:hypothetical protein
MPAPAYLLLLVLIGLLGAGPAAAQVIPPGEEELLGAMLGSGAQLPDGCALADGQVEHDVVRATYHCPDGDVVIQLSHPSVGDPQAIRTKRFALSVISGTPPGHLIGAVEALIRSKEADFKWNALGFGASSRWFCGLLLFGLTGVACVSGWRAWAARGPMAYRAALEALIVAAVVVIWLQIDAEPPAHGDTAVDVALARDCIASRGASCLGHPASAIGLLQGQAFTYGLAVWLYLGLSMRALLFVAACVHGAATGLLHYVTSRRFGGVAWVVSAFAASMGVQMAGYPTIWNPSWFPLPLSIAFVATLAIAGGGVWSPFVAGVAFAIASESHLLFGTFVAVAVVLVVLTAQSGIVAVTVLPMTFVLSEIAISPVSSAVNAIALRSWLGSHLVPAVLAGVVLAASIPMQLWLRRRLVTRGREAREAVAVAVWLLTGAVGIGLVLPWAVSRPVQIRYYGAALPAIPYAGALLLDAATFRARSASLYVLSVVVFAAILLQRMTGANFAMAEWFMDDGKTVAAMSGLVNTSALDIQMIVRPMPPGPLAETAAALVGTPDLPGFPARIVRAVRPRSQIALPDGWTRTHLAHGEAFIGDIDAWAHPEEAEICPEPVTGETCILLARDDWRNVAATGESLQRVFGLRLDRLATQIGRWAQHGTQSLLWKIPLRAVGTDDAREIVFYESGLEQIVTVEGTAWTARAANRASIGRPAPGTAASITVRTPIAAKFEGGVPPMPVELREEEVDVLRGILPP